MDRKKVIILSSLSFILIVFIILTIIVITKDNKVNTEEEIYSPKFLNNEQKLENALNTDSKVQVFYDSGGNMIYKVIRDDSEIVVDPEKEGYLN